MATVSAVPTPKTAAAPEGKLSMSVIAIAVVCLAALTPLLLVHMHQLWVRPHYQFFPLILIGAAVLAWSRRAEFQHVQAGSNTVTIGLLAFAWLLLAGAEVLNSSWLAAVCALVLVLTVLQTLGLVHRLFVVWLYLWLLIPPPFGLDNRLIMGLQTLATRWSSSLLDLFRVQHLISGHVIEVGGHSLFVEEACAGINSLFSILACALFYVILMRVHFVRATLLLLASIAWVLVANMFRIFIIAFLKPRDIHLDKGWRHDALGLVLFVLALGLIVSTHRLLLFFTPFAKTDADAPQDAPDLTPQPEATPWTTALNQSNFNSWAVGGAFGLLLVTHFAVYGLPQPFIDSNDAVRKNVQNLSEVTLPKDLDGWRRERWKPDQRSVSNAFGEFSKAWLYQGEGLTASVSVDYPFAGWHELSECYSGAGWDLEKTTNNAGTKPDEPAHFCEQTMKKSGLRWGYLLYCQIDSRGQALTPPVRGMVVGTIYRQRSLLSRLLARNNPDLEIAEPLGSVYQLQLFVDSSAALTPEQKRRTQARFFKAYSDIKEPLFKGVNPKL